MTTNTWDDMRRAKEESYFERKNKEALARLSKNQQEQGERPSPITGEPMEQVVIHGVVIDRCPTSKGIWLDAGELEELMEHAAQTAGEEGHTSGWFVDFVNTLAGKK